MTVDTPDRGAIPRWLLVALAVPRIARAFHPEVWIEDDFYLESAYLVSAGLRPYLDFVHPHPPLIEWLAAAYLRLAGASHLRLELLNQGAIYATSLLVFALARRAFGGRAAVAAALLFASSSLTFRYHLWERECFVAPLVVAAAIAAQGRPKTAARQTASISALLALACAIKLTAGVPATVIVGFLAIAQGRAGRALATGLAIAAALGALGALGYRLYGSEFLFQTLLFHFLKGRDLSRGGALYPADILDVLAPLLLLGVVRIAVERGFDRARGLVLAIAAAEYAFFGLLSPTAWAHNYLVALPFIAIVAAWGALWTLDALRDAVTRRSAARGAWIRLAGTGALLGVGLVWATPLVNQNWLRGSVYGFGFVSRGEIAALATALRAATAPDEAVVAPSFLCFEANRRQLIRYPETYGVWREAQAEFRRDGFAAARARFGRADFLARIIETSHHWTDAVNSALADGSLNAVISDSPIQLLPLVHVPDDALVESEFRPALRTQHFTLWLRDERSGSSNRGPGSPRYTAPPWRHARAPRRSRAR